MQKFWCVLSDEDEYIGKKYASFASAQNEAERLALANPGFKFLVVELMGHAERPKPDPIWHKAEPLPPF